MQSSQFWWLPFWFLFRQNGVKWHQSLSNIARKSQNGHCSAFRHDCILAYFSAENPFDFPLESWDWNNQFWFKNHQNQNPRNSAFNLNENTEFCSDQILHHGSDFDDFSQRMFGKLVVFSLEKQTNVYFKHEHFIHDGEERDDDKFSFSSIEWNAKPSNAHRKFQNLMMNKRYSINVVVGACRLPKKRRIVLKDSAYFLFFFHYKNDDDDDIYTTKFMSIITFAQRNTKIQNTTCDRNQQINFSMQKKLRMNDDWLFLLVD